MFVAKPTTCSSESVSLLYASTAPACPSDILTGVKITNVPSTSTAASPHVCAQNYELSATSQVVNPTVRPVWAPPGLGITCIKGLATKPALLDVVSASIIVSPS